MNNIDSLLAEGAALRLEVASLRQGNRDLADLIECYDVAAQGPGAVAKEVARLQALIRTVEATGTQWRETVRALERERFVLRAKAGVA